MQNVAAINQPDDYSSTKDTDINVNRVGMSNINYSGVRLTGLSNVSTGHKWSSTNKYAMVTLEIDKICNNYLTRAIYTSNNVRGDFIDMKVAQICLS